MIFPITLLVCALASADPATIPSFDPTANYASEQLEGWALRVNRRMLAEPKLLEDVRAVLRVKLFEINRVIPRVALEKLHSVPIWIELNDPGWPCMCYHASADWLRENGYNPDKAGGVEIANARNFLSWTLDQPWMVLHELAHAYHFQVLGEDNAEIKVAFKNAKSKQLYESVLRTSGKMERAYAMNNPGEYFAESSEAFFGTNDYFPFTHAELLVLDPDMERLLRRLWGAER